MSGQKKEERKCVAIKRLCHFSHIGPHINLKCNAENKSHSQFHNTLSFFEKNEEKIEKDR